MNKQNFDMMMLQLRMLVRLKVVQKKKEKRDTDFEKFKTKYFEVKQ